MKITSNIGHSCVRRDHYYRQSNWDSSIGIATCYELGGRGSIPGRGMRFFVLPSVHTGSAIHSSSYTKGTGDSFSMDKAAGVLR
jgi:hypothetical protein